MKHYTVDEVANILRKSTRVIYKSVASIEKLTPYRFKRVHGGHFYRGRPRKQLVISVQEVILLEEMFHLQSAGLSYHQAIIHVFGES